MMMMMMGMEIPVSIVPMGSVEVDQVVDADLGGVRLGEVEEGDVAQEPLGRHRGVVFAPYQGPYLLLAIGQSNW